MKFFSQIYSINSLLNFGINGINFRSTNNLGKYTISTLDAKRTEDGTISSEISLSHSFKPLLVRGKKLAPKFFGKIDDKKNLTGKIEIVHAGEGNMKLGLGCNVMKEFAERRWFHEFSYDTNRYTATKKVTCKEDVHETLTSMSFAVNDKITLGYSSKASGACICPKLWGKKNETKAEPKGWMQRVKDVLIPTVETRAVAVGYEKNNSNFMGEFGYGKSQYLKFGFVQNIFGKDQVGVEVFQDLEIDEKLKKIKKPVLTFAMTKKIDPETSIKAKVNSSFNITTMYQMMINKNCKASICFDHSVPNKSSNFGFSVETSF